MPKMSKLTHRMNFNELMESIAKGDARVAAIVASAWLDELLFSVLQHNFIRLSQNDENDLFEGNGPLSTFSSRIKTAYALGLISRKLRSDLDAVRVIRNDFAHQLRNVNLDHQAFKSRILGLNALRDTTGKHNLSVGELLARAIHVIGLFLIGRTAPSHIRYGGELLSQLKCLDYSNFEEVRRRDNRASGP